MDKNWAIGIAVCLGVVGGAVINKEIDERRARAAIQQFQREMEANLAASDRASREFQRQQAMKAQFDEQRKQSAIYERQAAIAAQQQNKAAQDIADFQQKSEREAAWKRFYKPKETCVTNWTGECADAFIVAKRTFADQYTPSR